MGEAARSLTDDNVRRTILIAEDEPLILMAFAEYLTEWGYLPIPVSNGDEAIRVLKLGTAVDVVLSDIRMPGISDGFAVARWIRAHRPELPVILITGYTGRSETPPDLLDVKVLRKPMHMKGVAKSIEDALERYSSADVRALN